MKRNSYRVYVTAADRQLNRNVADRQQLLGACYSDGQTFQQQNWHTTALSDTQAVYHALAAHPTAIGRM